MNLRIIGGGSHKAFAAAICKQLGISETPTTSKLFSNGNRFLSIDESVRGDDVFVIQSQVPPVGEYLMELFIYLRTLRDASAGRITAVLPYFPYARSDKKDQPRVCISARLLADLMSEAGANRVITMELHAPQIQGFFSVPCDHLLSAPPLVRHLRKHWNLENYTLVAGDAGAAKMVKRFADGLNLPVAIMDKRRSGNNEEVSIKGVIGDVTGKKALIIDDETSTGKTLVKDATFLLTTAGALSVDACVAHAAFDAEGAKRLADSPIRRFITTDTIPSAPLPNDRYDVVTVTDTFAECIRRVHQDLSLQSLNEV
jgi:ribose-phosphate pyrophosphokinase